MAQKRMTFLQKLMDFSGINPERLRLRWVSSAEASEFVDQISQFVEDIKKMGPNPLKAKEAA
jgi:F420-non-reducing hydrogenase iron-sulfur subunit